MYLGVDYYPEQWDPSLMERDLDRICELGANVIRIGEFAWHRMERRAGKYDFSFFDTVIGKARERGLWVIFGTPTATPPAWLIHRHPEILPQDEAGTPRSFGGRHTFCFSSDLYRRHCKRIVRKLCEHYKDERGIVAWQIDNEIGHEGSDVCWCPRCREKFRRFLYKKFDGDIERLNAAYGTVFWSQEYNGFDEIPLPLPTVTTHNPALRLDFERFCSENIVSFCREQTEIIRSVIPDAVILHDFPGGGLSKHVDYAAVAETVDRVAYNNYPVWGGQREPLPASEIAFGLDYIRGLRQDNFWITEAIMGAQGHDITGFLPRPGQAKLWSFQGMVRGCEGLLYFRYRGATKGAEQFCYGILDADNIRRRRFFEVQSFFSEVREYEDVLTAPVESRVALLYDYDSLASFRIQKQSVLLDCEREMKRLHGVFFRKGQMVDVLPARADFSGYRLVVVPHMIVTDDDFIRRLKSFVAGGGIAVVTYRTAIKDRQNNLTFGKVIPVGMDDLLGLYIEETESVQEYDAFPLEQEGGGHTGHGGIFRDMAVPTTARVLYRYGDSFYGRFAAITENDWGSGVAFYLGTTPDGETLTRVLGRAMERAGLAALDLPEGVEAVTRSGGRRLRWLLNHNACEVTALGQRLPPFGVLAVPV